MNRQTLIALALIAGIGAIAYYAFEQGSVNFPGIANTLGDVVNAITGKLSAGQIAEYASAAGFQGEDLATAVAVALAESGGKPSAQGDYGIPSSSPNQYNAIGLWQINIAENPQFSSWNLTDPAVNAQAAFQLYQQFGSSFRAWSTYNSDNYLAFLDAGESAAQNV